MGLKFALSAGAALSQHMNSFYGTLICAPLSRPFEERDFLRLAQLYSGQCILLDRSGRRFVDESVTYHHNARAVAAQPGARALLVGDHESLAIDRSGYGGVTEQIDRPAEAAKEGANSVELPTLEMLDAAVAGWGYPNVAAAVHAFNQDLAGPDPLSPSRRTNRRPLTQPPFVAVEVQPAVTFTFGGPLIDPRARVLREDRIPVPGLLAAGADAGGLYHDAYLGGLAMGLAFGRRAARTVAESTSGFEKSV
jgi:hypothetical protein